MLNFTKMNSVGRIEHTRHPAQTGSETVSYVDIFVPLGEDKSKGTHHKWL